MHAPQEMPNPTTPRVDDVAGRANEAETRKRPTPGITKITLRGRVGRDRQRTCAQQRWEVKAYDRRTKKTTYVGRFKSLAEAKAAKARFEQAHGGGGAGTARMTLAELVDTHYLKRTMTLGRSPRRIKRSTITTNVYAMRPFVATFGATRVDRLDEDVVIAWCESSRGRSWRDFARCSLGPSRSVS